MVLDPIPQILPVHFFGSRPQPPTSRLKTSHLKKKVRERIGKGMAIIRIMAALLKPLRLPRAQVSYEFSPPCSTICAEKSFLYRTSHSEKSRLYCTIYFAKNFTHCTTYSEKTCMYEYMCKGPMYCTTHSEKSRLCCTTYSAKCSMYYTTYSEKRFMYSF